MKHFTRTLAVLALAALALVASAFAPPKPKDSAAPPAPSSAGTVFEFCHPGFDGSTDATDHLVVWIVAESEDRALDFLCALDIDTQDGLHATDLSPDDAGIDYDMVKGGWDVPKAERAMAFQFRDPLVHR